MKTGLGRIDHSVIAFAGVQSTGQAMQAFFDHSMGWLRQLDCLPTGMGWKEKTVRFSEKKMRDRGFLPDEPISLLSVPPDLEHHLQGYNCCVLFTPRYSECSLDFRSSKLALQSAGFLEIAGTVIHTLKPQYGIGYRRPFGLGPSWYAMGIVNGDIPEEEGYRISQWIEGRKREVYNHGQTRDVYPLNFLNASQLEAKIGKQTLADWIRDKPSRGTLEPFANDLTLWTVEDKHIPALQKPLYDAGIIFDYERDIWAKQHHPPITTEEALGQVLNAMGYTPEEAKVLKVEKPGQTRELSTDEVMAMQSKAKKPSKKA